MSSSSTLVNVAEDAEVRLVKLLADSGTVSPTFVETCESCLANADAAGLTKTIVNESGAIDALLVLDPREEAVSAFSLLSALLDRVDDSAEAASLATALAEAVMTGKAGQAERRITLLSALYNLRSSGTEKCSLVANMIRLAATHQPALLVAGKPLGNLLAAPDKNSPPRIATLLDGWGVAPADQRALYREAADGIPDAVSKQRFTLLLAETYSDSIDNDGLAAAKTAAIGAIKDPVTLFRQQRTMLTMPAIQALASNTDTKVLHGLSTVFQEGKLEDYKAFVKQNGGESAVLTPHGLSADDCTRHMRILSLCSLAAEHEEIPYANVAQTLELPSDAQVESWVIAAVSSGLLSAKMDQLQHKVMVERSVVRKFDMEQWKSLQSQLHQWKDNVRGILDAFAKSQTTLNATA